MSVASIHGPVAPLNAVAHHTLSKTSLYRTNKSVDEGRDRKLSFLVMINLKVLQCSPLKWQIMIAKRGQFRIKVTIYTPGIEILTVSPPLGRIQHLHTIITIQLSRSTRYPSLLGGQKRHDMSGMIWYCQTLLYMTSSTTWARVTIHRHREPSNGHEIFGKMKRSVYSPLETPLQYDTSLPLGSPSIVLM